MDFGVNNSGHFVLFQLLSETLIDSARPSFASRVVSSPALADSCVESCDSTILIGKRENSTILRLMDSRSYVRFILRLSLIVGTGVLESTQGLKCCSSRKHCYEIFSQHYFSPIPSCTRARGRVHE